MKFSEKPDEKAVSPALPNPMSPGGSTDLTNC